MAKAVLCPLVLVVETMLGTLPDEMLVVSGVIARMMLLDSGSVQYPVAIRRLNPAVFVVAIEATLCTVLSAMLPEKPAPVVVVLKQA
jgi:hypothetical protein